jgi:hypothetical protein
MKTNFTKKQISDFGKAVRKFFDAAKKGDTFTGNFCYDMSKIRKGIKDEIECITAYEEAHLKTYNEERLKLLETLAKKDETTGDNIGQGQGFILFADPKEGKKALDVLNEKHKETLDAQKKFMDETVSLDLWQIDRAHTDQKKINPMIIEFLEPLIVEKIIIEGPVGD